MTKLHPRLQTQSLVTLLGVIFLMASCGSYQQASYYDDDGIYSEEPSRTTVYTNPQKPKSQAKKSDGVYDDYFGQKANELDQMMEDEVFTDVDDYYGGTEQDSLQVAEEGNYFDKDSNDYLGYAGWGDNASETTINVYEGGGFNYGWGGVGIGIGIGWGWGWGGYWGPGWGWGYPGWGWAATTP